MHTTAVNAKAENNEHHTRYRYAIVALIAYTAESDGSAAVKNERMDLWLCALDKLVRTNKARVANGILPKANDGSGYVDTAHCLCKQCAKRHTTNQLINLQY